MKKTLLFLGLASVMLGFTGCAKDDAMSGDNSTTVTEGITAPETIFASMGDGATRTSLTPTGKSALWTKGDKIAIFGSSTGATPEDKFIYYTLEGAGANAMGTFKKTSATTETFTKLPFGGKLNTGDKEILKRYIAVYPAEGASVAAKSGTQYNLVLNVPAEQTYYPNSYDPMALTMVSAFDAGESGQAMQNLNFKYANALLCLPVTGDNSTEFSQITVYAASGKNISYMTGDVKMGFADAMYGGSVADRLKSYTDMTIAFKPNSTTPAKAALNMTAGATPLKFGATESKIYFGILPKYYSGQIHVEFCLMNGSKFEKLATAKEAKANEVLTLPSSSVIPPYIPTSTLAGDVTTLTNKDAAKAASYTVEVALNGKVLYTHPTTEATVNFTTAIAPELNKLRAEVLPMGKNSLELIWKAILVDKTVATASYAIPLAYTYDRAYTNIKPTLVASPLDVNDPEGYKIYVDNAGIVEDNGGTMELWYVENNTATYPDGFATHQTVANVNYSPMFPYGMGGFGWVRGKEYSYVVVASYARGSEFIKVASEINRCTVALGEMPKAIKAKIADLAWTPGTDPMAPYLQITNYRAIMNACPDAKIIVYGVKGQSTQITDTVGMQHFTYDSKNVDDFGDFGGLDLASRDFPAGRQVETTMKSTYKIFVTGSQIATTMTTIVSDGVVPKPTEVELKIEAGRHGAKSLKVSNGEDISTYLNPNPAITCTIYAKKCTKAGVAEDMTDIEKDATAPKYILSNVEAGKVDLATFPEGRMEGDDYTYKCILTGHNEGSVKTLNISGVTDDSKISNMGGM